MLFVCKEEYFGFSAKRVEAFFTLALITSGNFRYDFLKLGLDLIFGIFNFIQILNEIFDVIEF